MELKLNWVAREEVLAERLEDGGSKAMEWLVTQGA